MNTIITLNNVSKYYKLYKTPKDRLKEAFNPFGKIYHKKFYAISDINLEIKKGEIVGIVGKNGSGKSTLLKIIAGNLQANSGAVKVSGSVSTIFKLGLGFNQDFTGMENLYFYSTVLGFSKDQINKRMDDILAFADIGEYINQPLKLYSSGMKMRLAFSVAVNIEPDILLLDEVFSVGDELFRKKSFDKMKEMFEGGKTIVYVSHSLATIRRLCNRTYMLDSGKIILEGNSKYVTKFYKKYIFSTPEEKQKMIASH